MAKWNLRITAFTDGTTTFSATAANGVYVEAGSAYGKQMVDRMIVMPHGEIHDLDGTDDAPLIYPKVWNQFVFSGASPNAHTQYGYLDDLVGKHGTLTAQIPTTGSPVVRTATARLLALPEETEWRPPYMANVKNWLMVRGIWQLKSNWTIA